MNDTPPRQDCHIDLRLIGPDEAVLRASAAEHPGVNPHSIRVTRSRKTDDFLLRAAITSAPTIPKETA